MGCCFGRLTVCCAKSYSVRYSCSGLEKRSSTSSSSVARGDDPIGMLQPSSVVLSPQPLVVFITPQPHEWLER
eukprot:scaffold4707_cov117-Isochrysis_galbana.AAC.3